MIISASTNLPPLTSSAVRTTPTTKSFLFKPHFPIPNAAKFCRTIPSAVSFSSSTHFTSGSSNWAPDSWKSKKALQLPEYPDPNELESVLRVLESFPPIVFAGEARKLEESLAKAAVGEAFLLQGGDCAESFKEFNGNNIRDTFRVLLQMGMVLTYGAQMPIIKVGRMAGQFAKPRSDSFEVKDGVKLPSYRGDNINADAFDEKSRTPDPQRLVRAYLQSVGTLNLLRAFATGGYAAMQRVSQWNLDFVQHSEQGDRYKELAQRVDEALGFMAAAGITMDHPIMNTIDFWTSHECLHLPYEQALTREDSTTGLYYDCSAHMLWVGERTRQLDGAHVEFLRGVSNPLGIKVSDKMDPAELVQLCEILNPHNKPGRLTIITRMGADNMRVKLPHLIRAVRQAGLIVTWVSDPMHGNTIKAPCGLKTRSFDSIRAELRAFFDVHEQEGSYPGGVHLEMTGQNVTECVGGSKEVTFDDLNSRYHTHCDPRLNASQSLELAFAISQRLRRKRMHSKPGSNGMLVENGSVA
ncbi:phospho-2-dehydro-3-deoxyheptonate aldolase 2, chloroplastic-like [Cucurbita moschata]|uniref:Phospho-2-dehydro-3-deoxyheptonate aldolase n=1 Tax=Cucurbita moschata TaxID=3662 RepID=A0A6J1G449_CUCMO|nr:phospho-2-dehydro-3-deoxyheptonate aldolase 2, chloroplastic-like [Cucurbita moschata]